MMLSADSWILPTGIAPSITVPTSCDEYGNVYVGTSRDRVDRDIWLGKYTPEGDALWTIDLEQPEAQTVSDVAASDNGVYIVGYFYGEANFDPLGSANGLLQSVGGSMDTYLAKYSVTGEFQWVRQWGGVYQDSIGSVEVVGDDAYVIGSLGVKRFDSDMLIAKVNGADGMIVWSKSMEDSGWSHLALWNDVEEGTKLYITTKDKFSRGYVTELTESPDGSDATFGWKTYFEPEGLPYAVAVGTDNVGGSIVPAIYATQTDNSNPDERKTAVVKFESNGSKAWSQTIPINLLQSSSLAVDADTVYLAGSFEGQADFDGPGPTAPLTASGAIDGYLARLDSADGRLTAVQRMGGSRNDFMMSFDLYGEHLVGGVWITSTDADYPIGLRGQMSAFDMSALGNEAVVMKLDVLAPIVEITSPAAHTYLNSGIPVTLTATASAGTIAWYESGVPFASGNSVTVTLSDGTHQISAIATDDAGRIGMAGVVIDVGLPVAVNDAANTSKDNSVTIDVLTNDSDPDGDALSVIDVGEPRNGTAIINPDDTITYSPNAEFTGTDWFSYTISDGKGGTDSAWVSVEVTGPVTETAVYVYDIRFVQHSRKADWWQAVFEIRADADGNGIGGNDTPGTGVAITVNFAGQTFTGTTDSNGIFTTDWVKKLQTSTNYYANVVDMALAGYLWDRLLDLEDDSDGDENPDDVLWFE
jgi:hypothetical protein